MKWKAWSLGLFFKGHAWWGHWWSPVVDWIVSAHPKWSKSWPYECVLIWGEGLCRCNYSKDLKIRSSWVWVGPIQRQVSLYETEKTSGGAGEDGGRDRSDARQSQCLPGATGSWKRHGSFSPRIFRASADLPTPWLQISGFQNCGWISSYCLSHQLCGNLL